MPRFELVSQAKALRSSAIARRSRVIREYLSYIEQLKPGQAGKLEPADGETVQAVRRRLGKAAKLTDKNLRIKRVGEEIYFWVESAHGAKPRGRQSKELA